MSNTKTKSTSTAADMILNYVDSSKGLRARTSDSSRMTIAQDIDGKIMSFSTNDLVEVLHRSDSEGKPFLQVNFKSGTKVLLTENLIGFKPFEALGLDMARIPKVVTTPDLKSVFEAIEESLGSDIGQEHEAEVLKKVYHSILLGAEKVGIDLPAERTWFNRLIASKLKAAA